MQTIYKYHLQIVERQHLDLPLHSQILSVQNQKENLVLYALVNTETKDTEHYIIDIYGTGHPIDLYAINVKFLGTVLMLGGSLVWHVYYAKL